METNELVAVIVTAALGGGGVASFVDAFKNRKKVKADTTQSLSESAVKMVASIQESLDEAQKDAAEARREASAAREEAKNARVEARKEGDQMWTQMHLMRREMETMVYRFRRLTGAILDDNVSREELKRLAQSHDTGGSS